MQYTQEHGTFQNTINKRFPKKKAFGEISCRESKRSTDAMISPRNTMKDQVCINGNLFAFLNLKDVLQQLWYVLT